ncbi:hypothetical protein BJ742DRAFT_743177 [Cladochytrium replicatum]|nr:hypothetical protein BJ742DRAFT_743177 [Cladochytrium replicatum]
MLRWLSTSRVPWDKRLAPDALRATLLNAAESIVGTSANVGSWTPLPTLLRQIESNYNKVHDARLPYRPSAGPDPAHDLADLGIGRASATMTRRANTSILTLGHVVVPGKRMKERVVVSTGFVVMEGNLAVTCLHTFEEIYPVVPSEKDQPSLVVATTSDGTVYPVVEIQSCLRELDLVLLRLGPPILQPSIPPLPLVPLAVSPFPTPTGSRVFAYQLESRSDDLSLWQSCSVVGYKDQIGREAKTGTYDFLAELTVSATVSPGSSGGPIVDEHGAVVGVIRGNVLSRSQGTHCGFATPAERIFEMFKFPVDIEK